MRNIFYKPKKIEYKNINTEWQERIVKNILLTVALILDRQTVCLWKLKGSVDKFLGNIETDSRSHYQRIKCCFKEGVEPRLVEDFQLVGHLRPN